MQRLSTPDEFQTRDLQLATALYAAGQRLIRLDWQGGRAFFVFAGRSRCEELVQAYWANDLRLPAKDFFSAMRELKDRLFQDERDGRSLTR